MTADDAACDPTKADDMMTLREMVPVIDLLQAELAEAIEMRRTIWRRRVNAGDTTKAELARASGCGPMNVTHGLRVPRSETPIDG